MLQSGARRMIYHGLPWQEDRMQNYLDFEKGLAELEGKAEELRALARKTPEMDMSEEATALDAKASVLLDDLYKGSIPGARRRSPATPTGPIARTTSRRCSPTGRRSPGTATSPTTTRSWAASPGSTTGPWW